VFLTGWFAFSYKIDLLVLPAVLAAVLYPVALLVSQGLTNDSFYPWFLAGKAKRRGGDRSWWFPKFAYWLQRYVRISLPRGTRDLIVRLQVQRGAHEIGAPIETDKLPGLGALRQAFRLRTTDLLFLMDGSPQSAAVSSQISRLEDAWNGSKLRPCSVATSHT
jgi:hypothetical protein